MNYTHCRVCGQPIDQGSQSANDGLHAYSNCNVYTEFYMGLKQRPEPHFVALTKSTNMAVFSSNEWHVAIDMWLSERAP